MPLFVVCVPAEGSASIAPCADVGGVPHIPATIETPLPGSVSFDNANQLFAYGLTYVLIFWALGVTVGAILSLIKRGG